MIQQFRPSLNKQVISCLQTFPIGNYIGYICTVIIFNPDDGQQPKTLGFAKSRLVAQPPEGAATARRPGGPVARRPTQFCCPAVNPRACSGLGTQMKDSEFEFVYHFNNHFNPFRSFLSLHVDK